MNKKKLHILFLSSWFPSRVLPINGDFVQRHAEAVALLNRVTVVHVITDPKLTKSFEIIKKSRNNMLVYIGYIKKTRNPFYKLFLFIKIYKSIFKSIGDFDIIHLNKLYASGVVALFLKIFKKKPYIITEHWSGYQKPLCNKISFTEKNISKLITAQASFVCPVSEHLGKAMRDFGLHGTYHPVPNVVITDIFKPKFQKNNSLTLLHVSSLYDEVKNVSGILNALGHLKKMNFDFFCYFIGGKSDNFTETLKKNNLNSDDIRFIDFVSQKELVQYFQKADAFLLFSHYENLPCVILEAFATGLPVIATQVGGIAEYFPDNFGMLIPPGDEQALAQAIQSIHSREWASKDTMHQYALRNFSPVIIAEEFTKLYTKSLF